VLEEDDALGHDRGPHASQGLRPHDARHHVVVRQAERIRGLGRTAIDGLDAALEDEGPTTATTSPGWTESDTSFSACVEPKRLLTCLMHFVRRA
jgi:hypothetical protein